MAFPLQPARGRTARRALVALAGAAGILLATVPASAAPANPATATEAAELIAARGHELEVLSEQFNEARENLAAQQAAAQAAQVEVERATAVLAEAQQSVRGVARSAYTGSGLNSFQALMVSGSADEFVNRMSTLQMVAGHQKELLAVATDASCSPSPPTPTSPQPRPRHSSRPPPPRRSASTTPSPARRRHSSGRSASTGRSTTGSAPRSAGPS